MISQNTSHCIDSNRIDETMAKRTHLKSSRLVHTRVQSQAKKKKNRKSKRKIKEAQTLYKQECISYQNNNKKGEKRRKKITYKIKQKY